MRPTRSIRSACSGNYRRACRTTAFSHRDSGSAANWFARDLKDAARHDGLALRESGHDGPGVPYAIAAKFACPDRPVIALVGDGAMLDERHQRPHHDRASTGRNGATRGLIVMVLDNRDLNQVTWEQRVMAGDPKYESSQNVPDFAFARYAEMLGLRGIRVRKAGTDRFSLGPGALIAIARWFTRR